VLCSLIENMGVRTLSAATGREGIDRALEARPGLILLEAILADADGFDVLKALKNTPEIESIPVIILSARAGEAPRQLALSLGACDVIAKPFDIGYTLDQVRNILRRASECDPQ
jgi:DNA-binding response OmpR family regulator